MNQKPGVMVYFDMLPAIEHLSKVDSGVLFQAILRYGRHEELPQMSAKLKVVWPLVQQRLDRDEEQYCKVVTKRAYSAYVRWAKHNKEDVMSFQNWQERKIRMEAGDEMNGEDDDYFLNVC
jgi:hypothetical protein